MKLVVFAHKPLPHHGQSYLVQLLLEGVGGGSRKRRSARSAVDFGIGRYHVGHRAVAAVANLEELVAYDQLAAMREHFLAHFALRNLCANLSLALHRLEAQPQDRVIHVSREKSGGGNAGL